MMIDKKNRARFSGCICTFSLRHAGYKVRILVCGDACFLRVRTGAV